MQIIFKSLYVGYSHLHFEASIIRLYMDLYPHAKIFFVGNYRQVDEVLKLISNSTNIKRITCSTTYKGYLSLFYLRKTFFLGKSLRVDLSGILPNSFYLFGAFQNHIYQHQLFINKKLISKFLSIVNFKITLFLNIFFNKNFKIITLGKWISDNYKKNKLFSNKEKEFFYTFIHPCFYKKSVSTRKILRNNKITFGFFGSQRAEYKNIDISYFMKIKELILRLKGSVVWNNEKFLADKEYSKLFEQTDYSVILYGHRYDFACSGVFIESIIFKKPVICISGSMTDYFFNRYGVIGYKFESEDELINGIQDIISHPDDVLYNKMIQNLEKASSDFNNFKTVALTFKKCLSSELGKK